MTAERHEIALPSGGAIVVVCTDRSDGDLRVDGPLPELDRRRRAVVDRPWVWLRQVHGATVVDGDDPQASGAAADAVVATDPAAALAVHTADCGAVALVGLDGDGRPVVAAVHAGWRGLAAGVVESAVSAVRRRGATSIAAYVGPCIAPSSYEFGAADLDILADRYGDGLRATRADGSPALDLRAGLRAALDRSDVAVAAVSTRCTAASDDLYSHRARGDVGRQALVVWVERGAAG